jgi:hypothetical protein
MLFGQSGRNPLTNPTKGVAALRNNVNCDAVRPAIADVILK